MKDLLEKTYHEIRFGKEPVVNMLSKDVEDLHIDLEDIFNSIKVFHINIVGELYGAFTEIKIDNDSDTAYILLTQRVGEDIKYNSNLGYMVHGGGETLTRFLKYDLNKVDPLDEELSEEVVDILYKSFQDFLNNKGE